MKTYKKEIQKTHEEWLNSRGIGGSDLAAICGKSKWSSPDDVYNRLVLGKQKNIKVNDRMQEGIDAEPHIRKLFALDLGKEWKMKEPPKKGGWLFRRLDYPLMTYTPDGLLENKTKNLKIIFESKDIELRYNKAKELDNWKNGILPNQYYYQLLQGQIVLNDYDGSVLVAHIKYYKFNDFYKEWVFDYAEDRNYWVFRDEITNDLSIAEKIEISFIVNNVNKKQRPKLSIKL